jgi:hypothetical protein
MWLSDLQALHAEMFAVGEQHLDDEVAFREFDAIFAEHAKKLNIPTELLVNAYTAMLPVLLQGEAEPTTKPTLPQVSPFFNPNHN